MSTFIFLIATLFACPVSNSKENGDFSPQGKTEFGILTSDGKNLSLVENFDVSSKLHWKYATKSGHRIEIYDEVLTTTQLQMLRVLTTYKLGSWSYRISEEDVKDGQKHVSRNDIPWYNNLDSLKFSETIVGKQLQQIIANFAGEESTAYYPYKVVGHVVRRGDFPKVHADASPEDEEITMMIYLNPKWRKNDYGDLYLYDDDKEIIAGVVPRYGRIAVWQSSIAYLPRPPSVAFKHGQLFLHISFTKNQTKAQHVHSEWLENEKFLKTIHSKGFFTPAEDVTSESDVKVQSHLVSEAKSKDGKKIVVFDGLFSKDLLDDLRSTILNYGVYYYDDSYEEDSDNVQWIAGFNVDHFVESNMWNITHQVAKFVSGGKSEWFPYDVSCNLIRNADTTQIHHDCESSEDEWTFLLYLNPEWSVNHYGETVFYERNDDNTEIITEVLPKYGRVVIFQGIIPHSARPPSTNFSMARLSFAVKLSENEWIGRTKGFQEQFRHVSALRSLLAVMKGKVLDETQENDQEDDVTKKEHGQSSIEEFGDIDPEEMSDPVAEELMYKLDTLTRTEERNIEDLRSLNNQIRKQHAQSIEEVGQLLGKLL